LQGVDDLVTLLPIPRRVVDSTDGPLGRALRQQRHFEDALRAVGTYLEPFCPAELRIFYRAHRVEASWRNPGLQAVRQAVSFGVPALQSFGQELRGHHVATQPSSKTDLLRALGAILDQACADEFWIVEGPEAFIVTALVDGSISKQAYTYDELQERAAAARNERLHRGNVA